MSFCLSSCCRRVSRAAWIDWYAVLPSVRRRRPGVRWSAAVVPEPAARAAIDAGRLRLVLEYRCPFEPGLFLYFPAHRHMPAPLRAFVALLKEQGGGLR